MDGSELKRMGKNVVLSEQIERNTRPTKGINVMARDMFPSTGYILIYKVIQRKEKEKKSRHAHQTTWLSTPHKSNLSQATRSLELKPKHTSNVPLGSTQFCLSTSQ